MFSFLKKLFNSYGQGNLEQFFQHTDLNKASWISIAINKMTMADSFLTKELDFLTETEIFSLKMAETKEGTPLQLWKNQESVAKLTLKHETDLFLKFNEQFNRLIDQSIEKELRHFQVELNKPIDPQSFSSAQMAQEEKGLEWMRVSFKILEQALVESLTNPDFLFQTLFFFGSNPKTLNHEIRLIVFNLDINFVLQKNGMLRIKIFNDKKGEFGSNKKPDLEGDFHFKKREMLDELTNLLSALSPGLKY